MKANTIKVFIVDDHEIFRNGMRQLINNETDMDVVGEASGGDEAIKLLKTLPVDVVIMDIRMPGMNGLDTGKAILEFSDKTKILIFSLYDREDYVSSALEMGAHGYILKDTSNKIFLNAIRAVNNGQYYFIGEISDVLVKKYHELKDKLAPDTMTPGRDIHLSKRESEILSMIKIGMSNKDIADGLGISIRTIETHRLNILRKFKSNQMDEVLELIESLGLTLNQN